MNIFKEVTLWMVVLVVCGFIGRISGLALKNYHPSWVEAKTYKVQIDPNDPRPKIAVQLIVPSLDEQHSIRRCDLNDDGTLDAKDISVLMEVIVGSLDPSFCE